MSHSVSWLAFIFVFCGFFIIDSTSKSEQLKERSGPYISTLKRIVKCDKPTTPQAKVTKPVGILELVDMKNNTLKGNFTILGKNKNMRVTIQELYYEDGRWQLTFNAQRVSCRSKLVALVADLLGITYNKKTCTVPKGSYVFEVDNNKVDHLLSPIREYGLMVRQLEVFNAAQSFACIRVESYVKPA